MDSSRERLWARHRRQARRLPLVLSLAGALVFLSASGSTAADPTIEAAGGADSYYWNPTHADTSTGGSVSFTSPSASVLHGLSWTGGPATPPCSGVPIDDGKTGWSGTCSFPVAGNYTFVCAVHPIQMKGTITAGSGDPGAPGPNPPAASDDPVASGLRIARRQRGRAVRGSVLVQEDGARLDVRLFATRSALFGKGSGKVPVGRTVRSVASGKASFVVPLKRVARMALDSRARLPLSSKVTVVAQNGEKFEHSRGVVLLKGKSSTGGRDESGA